MSSAVTLLQVLGILSPLMASVWVVMATKALHLRLESDVKKLQDTLTTHDERLRAVETTVRILIDRAERVGGKAS